MLKLLARLRARIRHRRFDDDLREELRLHEEMSRQALEAEGLPPDEARAAARRALGNVTLMRERSRAVWLPPSLESVAQDVRYAVRSLGRQPLHSFAAVAVLVLGIGLPLTLFSLFKGIFLDPWPVREPDEVVRIWARASGRPVGPSVDEYRYMRNHVRSMSGLVAFSVLGYPSRLQAPGGAEVSLQSAWVTANFFDVLGVRMHLGEGFLPGDDLPGGARSPLVISHVAWRTHFHADPNVVGRNVHVGGRPFTITGVAPRPFDGIGREVHLWMHLSAYATARQANVGWEGAVAANCCISVAGRLAPGVREQQARAEIQVLHERFIQTAGRQPGIVELWGTSGLSGPGQRGLPVITAFGGAVALILVLACANVGNLQLARALARRREIATRMSIGASRRRVIRQLLTEGFVLAAVAGAGALALATVLPKVIFRIGDEEIPEYIAARLAPDATILGFTLIVCVLACLTFALAPALHATRLQSPLGTLDRGATRAARFPLRGLMLAAQIAACTALLAGAGLVTRAIVHAMDFDPGFAVAGVDVVTPIYPAGTPITERVALTGMVLDSAESSNDARVAVAELDPFDSSPLVMSASVGGPLEFDAIPLRQVSSRFFEVLGVPLVRGRTFDHPAGREAVVNETFARRYWPEDDPIGRTVDDVDRKGGVRRSYTVVGVVRDTHLRGLDGIGPMIFTRATLGMFLTRGGPAAVERIRASVAARRPDVAVTTHPLRSSIRRALQPSVTAAAMAWTLGLLGLSLAAVGVFGVFAYAVEERRREIGVRLALGARGSHIVRLLVSSSGRAMVVGLGLGLLLSLACGPLLGSFLLGLSPLDPLAYALVVTLLAVTAMLATALPARRACRVDPATTLRAE